MRSFYVRGKGKIWIRDEEEARDELVRKVQNSLEAMRENTPGSRRFNAGENYVRANIHLLPVDLRAKYEKNFQEIMSSAPSYAPKVCGEVIRK